MNSMRRRPLTCCVLLTMLLIVDATGSAWPLRAAFGATAEATPLAAISTVAATALLVAPTEAETLLTDPASREKFVQQHRERIAQLVALPEELTEFSWQYEEYSYFDGFRLTWATPDSTRSVRVSVNWDGWICSFHSYQPSKPYTAKHFPKLSEEELRFTAREAVARIIPEIVTELSATCRYEYSDYIPYGLGISSIAIRDTSRVIFQRTLNGLPVLKDELTVEIDNQSGEVVSVSSWLNFSRHSDLLSTVADPKAKISQSQVVGLLQEQGMLQLRYQLASLAVYPAVFAPSPTNDGPATLAYVWFRDGTNYLDANSGKLLGHPDEIPGYSEERFTDFAALHAQAEQDGLPLPDKAADKAPQATLGPDGRITVASAEALVRSWDGLALPEDAVLLDYKYAPNGNGKPGHDELTLTFTEPGAKDYSTAKNISIDAHCGELIGIALTPFNPSLPETVPLTPAEIYARALRFLSQSNQSIYADLKPVEYIDEDWSNSAYLRFTRTHQSIPVEGNGVYINIDIYSGEVTGFRLQWNEGIRFPEASKALTLQQAYETVLAAEEITLGYRAFPTATSGAKDLGADRQESGSEARLVYDLSRIRALEIDAISGKPIHRVILGGNASQEPAYSDLPEGSAKDKVLRTARFLGFPQEPEFHPDAPLTQRDMLYWISLLSNGYRIYCDDDSLAAALIRDGILLKEEREPERQLTQMEAVVLLIRLIGLDRYAKAPIAYLNPLQLPESQAGYAALATHYKMIDFETFKPEAPLTRLDGALLLYNLLSR